MNESKLYLIFGQISKKYLLVCHTILVYVWLKICCSIELFHQTNPCLFALIRGRLLSLEIEKLANCTLCWYVCIDGYQYDLYNENCLLNQVLHFIKNVKALFISSFKPVTWVCVSEGWEAVCPAISGRK